MPRTPSVSGGVFCDVPIIGYRVSPVPHVFGTDTQGKGLLASIVYGTGLTLQIGAIAGFLRKSEDMLLFVFSAADTGNVDEKYRAFREFLGTVEVSE